jgi:hypothetical protein
MQTYKFREGDKVRIAKIGGMPERIEQLDKYVGQVGAISARRKGKYKWYKGPTYFVNGLGEGQVPWFKEYELEFVGEGK